ncbi:MAG TPA: hypothetical protein VFU59_08815 [Candidatus Eisenbacteria bacterium]|nr:hypothetical protein [Candidatus Eisenbacteria bacterium]
MPDLIGRWLALDWHDPFVVALVGVILVVALWRRWALVLLAALVVALGQGVDYLLRHADLSPALAQGFLLAVYGVGALFLVFLAVARFTSKR